MAMFRPVRIFFDPLIATLFPIPKIALMPLLLLAFGFGDASKIALVVIAVFFPVVVNTYVGAANIERIYWDVAKNYGASQSVIFRRIVFFGALPMIFAGLRIALAVSFIVLVAAEFVATKTGIGYLIWNSWELLQVDVMFVGIVTVGVLGLIATVMLAGDRAQGHSLEDGVGAPILLRRLDRAPDAVRRRRHVHVLDAVVLQRVHDGVHHHRQRRRDAGLAAAFDAQRIAARSGPRSARCRTTAPDRARGMP